MMIGPAPMIRILSMSSRRGIRLFHSPYGVSSVFAAVVGLKPLARGWAVHASRAPHSWTNPGSAQTERAAQCAPFQERRESVHGGSGRAIPGAHGPEKAHIARHAPPR